MIRIILGILIMLALLSAFVTQTAPNFETSAEMQGYVMSQIAFIVLAIWLIYSGIQKRRAKKGKTTEKSKMGVIEFLKSFFGGYKTFLHKNIELKRPPYWLFIIWFYGVSRVLIRFDSIVSGMGSEPMFLGWFDFWLVTLVLGAIIGFIGYWLVGSIFHLGVLLAGGHKKAKTSRMIYVYSILPHTIVVIAIFFVTMLGMRENFFLYGGLDPIWFHITTAVSLYSIILGYIGVREIQKTKKIRSILLFIVFPILVRVSIFLYAFLA